jgi:protein-tyrosine phosphatase
MFNLDSWKDFLLKKILFVCSGNTCRSPLAEGIAKKILSDRLSEKIEVSSAGTSAIEGVPASDLSIRVAREHGIDLSRHRARLLNKTLINESDLIVAMSSKHRDTVGIIEPAGLDRTYMLTDFCAGEGGDIPDPIGSDLEGYQKVFEQIKKCLEQMRSRMGGLDQRSKGNWPFSARE